LATARRRGSLGSTKAGGWWAYRARRLEGLCSITRRISGQLTTPPPGRVPEWRAVPEGSAAGRAGGIEVDSLEHPADLSREHSRRPELVSAQAATAAMKRRPAAAGLSEAKFPTLALTNEHRTPPNPPPTNNAPQASPCRPCPRGDEFRTSAPATPTRPAPPPDQHPPRARHPTRPAPHVQPPSGPGRHRRLPRADRAGDHGDRSEGHDRHRDDLGGVPVEFVDSERN